VEAGAAAGVFDAVCEDVRVVHGIVVPPSTQFLLVISIAGTCNKYAENLHDTTVQCRTARKGEGILSRR